MKSEFWVQYIPPVIARSNDCLHVHTCTLGPRLLSLFILLWTTVSPMMELKPNAGSDRAWVWNTLADYADECPKPELLAIRFLNAESKWFNAVITIKVPIFVCPAFLYIVFTVHRCTEVQGEVWWMQGDGQKISRDNRYRPLSYIVWKDAAHILKCGDFNSGLKGVLIHPIL